MTKKPEVRKEKDSFGEVQLPANAYWGAQTARSLECRLGSEKANPHLLQALVMVKKAAALANSSVGALDQTTAKAIASAADEVLSGQWQDQFIGEAFQFGAGASLIANINEVLANRSNQLLGGALGTYEYVHPQNHVNLGQSTSDVFPTAMRLATLFAWRELEPILIDLERLLRRKSLEFEKIAKVGRAHLRDSVPVTLGQEFNAYGSSVERSVRRIKEASQSLLECNLGSTAVGTGYGTDVAFGPSATALLSGFAGIKFRQAEDVFRVTQSMADFIEFSSTLKELAIELAKIATDLRLLSSGPHAGLAEIRIPPVQTEPSNLSGILPDHAPPYLTECLSMVSFQVMGNDFVASLCAQAGQLDTNAMTPLLINSILESLDLLKNCLAVFNSRCLAGITADNKRCSQLLDLSGANAAAVSAYIGVDKAAQLLARSQSAGKSIRELVLEEKLMTADVLDRILHYKSLTRPGNVPIGNAKPDTAFNTTKPIDKG